MARSLWKGPYFGPCFSLLWNRGIPLNKSHSKNKTIPSYTTLLSRRDTILPAFVSSSLRVHNGLKTIPLNVTPDMLFLKAGSFSSSKGSRKGPRTRGRRR